MSRYARAVGRKKYPGRRRRRGSGISTFGLSEVPEKELVCVGSRINGVVKSAISPEILKKTEGLPWHARVARIAAITGMPFVEVNKALES